VCEGVGLYINNKDRIVRSLWTILLFVLRAAKITFKKTITSTPSPPYIITIWQSLAQVQILRRSYDKFKIAQNLHNITSDNMDLVISRIYTLHAFPPPPILLFIEFDLNMTLILA